MPAAKHILVAGATRSIGLAVVRNLLRRIPEAVIFATARNPDKASDLLALAASHRDRVHVVQLDITSVESNKALVADLRQKTTSLEQVWINGALIGPGKIPINEVESSAFSEILEANVIGAHNVARYFTPFLLASTAPKKELVFMASAVGSYTLVKYVADALGKRCEYEGNPFSAYSISKAAMIMLAKQYALILEPLNVGVVPLHPGTVKTDGFPQGDITPDESAEGVISRVIEYQIGDGEKGLLAYNGKNLPL